ncbi:endolytic transglycosylase MltG [Streptomyces lunaelactis]|uniref:endolytic transglycosylase MltG n=1 Tax=Streptomyces lunaelactis TaxID=1535768 RepID=UPI0015856C98|nr:endolytic transglycosylase MltG [Streptomyces lunaelactis]NUK69838.1 endolytic transglycosylase MltG [Streptomyces lunaelactis]NUK80669.1 endolytic transglycosylase MltG [Streptomyces lunaelactis]
MTEYGRSPGSEPWHPEDPLYGDQGWGGPQAAAGQTPYGGQPQQQDPQQPQQYGTQQDPYQQYNEQQQYNGQQRQQYNQQQQQQYNQQQQQQQQYNQQQQQQYNQQQYNTGWDTGQQPAMPYGAGRPDPYDGQQPGYSGENADYYATPEAYPPPQPPSRRQAEPEPTTDWDAEAPQEETHPFFTGDDGRDDDGEYDDDPRESRRGGGRERRGKGKKKSRNGCACLVVSLVLAGGLGGVGYFGYQFWQGQFGAAEDFSGSGSGSTQVEIPKGAGLGEIGSILKEAGVVKSSGAFVSAADGKSIQAGVYILKKGMSGENAVDLMLDPASRNNLIVPPGKRNSWVYEQVDKRLEVKVGTTKAVAKAKAKTLGLPDWADDNPDIKDPLEGFLFPATYPVAKGMKPEAVLQKMVAQANAEFGKKDLKAEAERLGLKSPLQVLTVASLVQAEGKYKHDFDKVSRVVYNRLKPNNLETVGRLEFDSTINYIKSESTLDVGAVDDLRKLKDPYNTYNVKGLPPGPIANPGLDAFNSSLKPTPGPWYYFVSITEDKTLFAVTNAEHERNRKKYEAEQEKSGQ